MYGPFLKVLRAEHRSRQEGSVPPPQELVWLPWVGSFLRTLAGVPPRDAVETVPPAVFYGWQETLPGCAPLALWRLTAPVLGHPTGSTVVTETLQVAGYQVHEPAPPPQTKTAPVRYD